MFDSLNHLTRVTYPAGETRYTYDDVGNRSTMTYPNDTDTVYTYDTLNRLDTITNSQPQGTFSSYDYTLGLAGNRTRVLEHDDRQVDYQYDDVYRLTREIVTIPDPQGNPDDDIVTTTTYYYDDVGNRTRLTRTDTSAPGNFLDVEYVYDAMDRLITETQTMEIARGPLEGDGTRLARCHSPPVPSRNARWRLVGYLAPSVLGLLLPLGLLISRPRTHRRIRTACLVYFLTPLMITGPEIVLAAHREAMLYHALGAAGCTFGEHNDIVTVYTYAYDANGNTISKSDGTLTNRYVYDFENRLILADIQIVAGQDLPGAVTYSYDADGIRQSKSADESYIQHLTDKNRPYAQVLEERDGESDALIVRYTYGDDLISQTRAGDTWYYHYDGQMSTRQLTAGAAPGAVTNTYTFDAFGNLLSSTTPVENNYLYTGEQYDPNVGFYYLRARYYSPPVGHFLTQDPIDGTSNDPRTLHKYLYAANDPMNKRDPTGLFTTTGVASAQAIRFTVYFAILAITSEVLSVALDVIAAANASEALKRLARGLDVTIQWRPRLDRSREHFLHGSSTGVWSGADVRALGRGDFGSAFYTFPLSDPRSLNSASLFAKKAKRLNGGDPFVLVVAINRSGLTTKRYMPPWNDYELDVTLNHTMGANLPEGVDVAIGPFSRAGRFPDHTWPIQYAWKSARAILRLKPVAIIPVL